MLPASIAAGEAALDRRAAAPVALYGRAAGGRRRQDSSSAIPFTGSHRFVLELPGGEVLKTSSRRPCSVFRCARRILGGCAARCAMRVVRDQPRRARHAGGHRARSNLFIVPLDNERRWYRYHHLFADLLRQSLAQR